jgi:hypothetical protein
MRSKEGAGVMRKLECHMGWVFGGLLEMAEGVSRTWSPIEYGMDLTFVFGRMCGVKK